MQSVSNSVIDLIGNTPIVKLKSFDVGKCELFVKLENQNPGGSIKDRIGLSIIQEAEKSGKLKPGGTIIEATAGNTGIGLALVSAIKGYKLVLVIPDKMSREKILHLQGLGAEVVITRSDVAKGHPEYYQDLAKKIADEREGSFLANQFSNPANALAHKTTTAPEIWSQMNHDVDAVVAGVGSGGTVAGISEYMKQQNSDFKMIVADPEGSIVADAVNTGQFKYDGGSWLVEGIGEDFIPSNVELAMLDEGVIVSDTAAFAVVRQMLEEEGILAGSSSGTLIAGAIKWCQMQQTPKRVVTFVCDTGNKYLSKAFNSAWLKDNGLLPEASQGNLADLISVRFDKGDMIKVSEQDTLLTAFKRMRAGDVSQLPVMNENQLVGIVDEEDILLNVFRKEQLFSQPVSSVMVTKLDTLQISDDEELLRDTLANGKVAIIFEGDRFLGFITKVDLINRYKNTFVANN
ncbi:MAG: pyridoxal-phosphate dependent enzyme [Candidatus Azotimanducaceae bacterium]|uniref:Cysteine synthase B n=1 Tax=OM182 bacterium TaxID=2510334 RepID=A0A520S0J8_9GAMM|nr:MAG: pyridoxal-phosphate dependent enzyme [OM182 bacterium]